MDRKDIVMQQQVEQQLESAQKVKRLQIKLDMQHVKSHAHAALMFIVTWQWVKHLLSWLILSAGTISECAFILASLWVCINASVHSFVLLFMSEQATQSLTSFAATAYVGLPELILPLAIVTTLAHWQTWNYNKSDYAPALWCALFGLPTLVFLGISGITLASSLANFGFLLPPPLVVVRGIAGYWYALVSLLYVQVGKKQETDRLKEKDRLYLQLKNEKDFELAQLRAESEATLADMRERMQRKITELQKENERINAELANQKELLREALTRNSALQNVLDKSAEGALAAYPEEVIRWLKSEEKSFYIDEVVRVTGHSKRRLLAAIDRGKLQVTSRAKDRILKSSLIEWLKNNPPRQETDADDQPTLHLVNE
jgi:hypothetical protein